MANKDKQINKNKTKNKNMKKIHKLEFSNSVDFVTWMDEQMVYEVLTELWHYYKKEEQRIKAIADEDLQEKALDELHERFVSELPLETWNTQFSICGQWFEVKDALSIASYLVSVAAEELPNTPDGWKNRGVQCTNGVKEFAYGFYSGVSSVVNR